MKINKITVIKTMMSYYRFYNITKGETNKSYVPLYSWKVNIEMYSLEEIIDIFEYVIDFNKWDKDDLVIAFNKQNKLFRYKCSTVNDYNPSKKEQDFENEIVNYYNLERDSEYSDDGLH